MNLGYYIVNDKQYSNKIEAIIAANKSKATIEWMFHDSVFNNVDFTIEPNKTLNQIYLERAIQLRKKYDYLILFFSGGSDSVHILNTFLENNIIIDEIIVSYPESGLKNYNFNKADTSASNNISEYLYNTKPYMSTIQQQYPNIKITLHDYFIDMLNYKTNDWLIRSSDWVHPATVAKFNLTRYTHINEILQNKSIGAIYGFEKPIVLYAYKRYYCILRDSNINGAVMPVNHPNMHTELFYITPEMPDLLIKQSHAIVNKCKIDTTLKNIVSLMARLPVTTDTIKTYHKSIIPIIYPDLVNLEFQTEKASTHFMVESDDWFYQLHRNTKTYNMIMTDYSNLINSLDDTYLVKENDRISSFKLYYKTYRLTQDICS